ncbi:hypothetical protein ACSBR2_032687 [Camellia fascicularis]
MLMDIQKVTQAKLDMEGCCEMKYEYGSGDFIENWDIAQVSKLNSLIEDAKFLLKMCDCSLQHTPRKGNKCTDLLVNMGVAQDEHVVVLEEPPEEVKALAIDDMTGVSVLKD